MAEIAAPPRSRVSFLKNATVVAGGTVGAQAINFAGYAFSSRFLSPADFGIFAAHVAISAPLALLATGRYEAAFIRANANLQVINLLVLCCVSAVLVALFSATAVGLLGYVASFLAPISFVSIFLLIAGQAMLNSFTQLSNYTRRYRVISVARTSGAAIAQGTTMGLALAHWGPQALCLGLAFGMIVSSALLAAGNRSWLREARRHFSLNRVRKVARLHRSLALYNAPQALAGAFQDSVAIAVITLQFGPAGTGLYSLSSRLLRAPISIVAESLGTVLQRYFADLSKPTGGMVEALAHRRRLLNESVGFVAVLGLVFAVMAWFFGPTVVHIVFEAKWHELGDVVRAAAPYYGAYLVGATLVATPIAVGANYRAIAALGVGGSALFVLAFGLSGLFTTKLEGAFVAVSVVMVAYFSVLVIYIYKLVWGQLNR